MERVICALLLLSSSALAQPTGDAQRHFQRGKELYEDNDYQAALVEFRRAYELAPSFRLLYNIAEMYYQLQDYPSALRFFARYLQEGGSEVPSERREEVQRELERLRGRVATLWIQTNRIQADLSVDDVPVGKSPLPDKITVSAGRRKITANLAGRTPVTKVLEVAGQDTVRVNLDFPPDPTPAAEPPVATSGPPANAVVAATPHSPRNTWLPWAVTGVLGAGALTTGLLAAKSSSDLQSQRAGFGATRSQLDASSQNAKRLGWVSDSLSGATLLAAGVSLYLMLTAEPEVKPEARASVQVGVGPGGVALQGAF